MEALPCQNDVPKRNAPSRAAADPNPDPDPDPYSCTIIRQTNTEQTSAVPLQVHARCEPVCFIPVRIPRMCVFLIVFHGD